MGNSRRRIWTIFLLNQMLFLSDAALPKHPITVSGNGYDGVTIAISNKVKANSEESFIANIKNIMTVASSELYKATRQHLYFKNITIVLPKSWSMDTGGNFVSGPQFDLSHIIVDLRNSVIDPFRPYVFGMTECGVQAQYIHITNQAVLTANQYVLGKTMIHEWGHFRWGLFDEYPETESNAVGKQRVAYTEDGTFKPNVCTEQVEGKFLLNCVNATSKCKTDKNGLLEEKCKFCPESSKAKASLMGYHYFPEITEFCDSPASADSSVQHNIYADTKQNRYCNRKSAWEVMRGHDDFKNLNPGPPSQITTPNFRIVKQGLTQIVLVFDVSGSMETDNRLIKLRMACTEYIENKIKEDSIVGIVLFNSTASVAHPLTKIVSTHTRMSLIDALPSVARGGTSIGAGLLKGLEILQASGNEVRGSFLILISDGQNTAAPSIEDVQQQIIDSGVIVTSLAFTEQSDKKMIALAALTGGQSFFISGKAESTALIDAFTQGVNTDDSYEGMLAQLDSVAVTVSENNSYIGSFYIDSSIGRNTKISITGDDVSNIRLDTVSSNNESFASTEATGKRLSLNFPEVIEPGRYTYTITTNASSGAVSNFVVNVVSSQRTADDQPIVVRVWTSQKELNFSKIAFLKMFASVNKGRTPVLNAEVIVEIEDNVGRVKTIMLDDNGSGSDIEKDDGIYSAFVLPQHIGTDGRHNIKLKVSSKEGMTRVPVPVEVTQNRTRRNVDEDESLSVQYLNFTQASVPIKIVLIEPFQRISQGGDFTVTNLASQTTVNTDNIAPAKITTLEVFERESDTFTLTWTAVGDDFDMGIASSYRLLISEDFKEIITGSVGDMDLNITMPKPRPSGETENVSITFQNSNTTYFVGITAVDEEGNEGELSNIISVSIIVDKQWVEEASTQLPITVQNVQKTSSGTKIDSRGSNTGMIIGICVACVIVIVCVFVLFVYFKRKRGKFHVENEMIPVPTEEV